MINSGSIIQVSYQNAELFNVLLCLTWRNARVRRGFEPYIIKDDRWLVISYDGKFKPFLGFSFGYNQKEDRELIPNCLLLRKVGKALRFHGDTKILCRSGGRVFLNSSEVLHNDEIICKFDWMGEDPLKSMYECMMSVG